MSAQKTIREAYGDALVKYGKDDPRVVVLDADVSSSTKSGTFGAACPGRFFNVGIAEANMAAMAAGFAADGKIPFVNTFAVFLTSTGLLAMRTFGGYGGLPIKFVGAYGGMSDAFDGATHHSVEDIAIMRAIPNVIVMVASDEIQADWMVRNAIDTEMPMYIRLSRDKMPRLYQEGEDFQTGRAKILRDGSDITICACGVMCGNALEAANILEKEGISVRVVDMFTIKPLDKETLLKCTEDTWVIVTAEEHSIIGGLGGAVAEALAEAGAEIPLVRVGINDRFTETGPYDELMSSYGLDAGSIAEKAELAFKKVKKW
jgi:Transketolase, C-terminal subunit